MTRPALFRSFVLTLLAMGLALAGAMGVPAATSAEPCRAPKEEVRPVSRRVEPPATHGVDLELRVLNLRVEFPWLKDLPITPGRRIVISWMERASHRE